jgi:hypothetical protein
MEVLASCGVCGVASCVAALAACPRCVSGGGPPERRRRDGALEDVSSSLRCAGPACAPLAPDASGASGYSCGNCLDAYARIEAAELGGRCRRCFTCPRCASSLTIVATSASTAEKPVLAFSCAACAYSSESATEPLVSDTVPALIKDARSREREVVSAASVIAPSSRGSSAGQPAPDRTGTFGDLQNLMDNTVEVMQARFAATERQRRQVERWSGAGVPGTSTSAKIVLRGKTPAARTLEMLLADEDQKRAALALAGRQQDPNERALAGEAAVAAAETDLAVLETEARAQSTIDDVASNAQIQASPADRSFGAAPQARVQVSDLLPLRRPLLAWRDRRCFRCSTLLVRPESGTGRVDFSQQYFVASRYIPLVQVRSRVSADGETTSLTLRLTNNLPFAGRVSIVPDNAGLDRPSSDSGGAPEVRGARVTHTLDEAAGTRTVLLLGVGQDHTDASSVPEHLKEMAGGPEKRSGNTVEFSVSMVRNTRLRSTDPGPRKCAYGAFRLLFEYRKAVDDPDSEQGFDAVMLVRL